MGETFAIIGVAVAMVVAVAWLLTNAPYVFWVRIRNGAPTVAHRQGRPAVPARPGRRAESISDRGWVGGVRRGLRGKLELSRSIPEPCRQQLPKHLEHAGLEEVPPPSAGLRG